MQAKYLEVYLQQLEPIYEVQPYDCCLLAELPLGQETQEERHQHFVTGGIQRAVDALINTEREGVEVLAFSVGGTIAWRAALAGMPIDQLFAISATRLRYETEKPNCGLRLWYGALDPYQPNAEWYEKMQLSAHQWPGHGHDIYKHPSIIKTVCQELLVS